MLGFARPGRSLDLNHSAGGALNTLKGFDRSARKNSTIFKADRNPAIGSELDNFAYFTLQRHLGLPGKSVRDQPDPISNFQAGLKQGVLLHFSFAFSPSPAALAWLRCDVVASVAPENSDGSLCLDLW